MRYLDLVSDRRPLDIQALIEAGVFGPNAKPISEARQSQLGINDFALDDFSRETGIEGADLTRFFRDMRSDIEGDPKLLEQLNQVRQQLGLPPVKSVDELGLNDPAGMLPEDLAALLVMWALQQQDKNRAGGGGQSRGSLPQQSYSNVRPAQNNWGGGGGGTSTGGGGGGVSSGGGATSAPDSASGPGNVKVNGKYSDILQRMNEIDQMKLPYLWGGGHAKKLNSAEECRATGGLDCSGSVSYALGLDQPLVSGNFGAVGSATPSPDSKITIYYNDGHVLMSIKDDQGKEHFWGTSPSNPGGGPGWIDRPSDSYLARFQRRYV